MTQPLTNVLQMTLSQSNNQSTSSPSTVPCTSTSTPPVRPPHSISICLVAAYTITLLLFFLSSNHSLGTGTDLSTFFAKYSGGIQPSGKSFTAGLALAWCTSGAGTMAGIAGALAGSVPAATYLRHWGIAMPISWACSAAFILCISYSVSWLALILECCAVLAASPAWYNVANVVVSHRIDFDPTTASPSATRVQLNRNFFLDLHTARDRLTFLYYFFLFHVPTSMYFGIQLVVTLATIMATGNDMHVVDFVEDRGTNPYVAALLISMVVIVVLLTGALGVWKNDVVLQTTVVVALLSMLENKSQSPALRLGILIAAGALAFCTLVVGTNMIRATLARRRQR
uniref:Uncharacterized protein n=1 Tax=Sexangularia sp. CB-2014 TaxID=1486929 RepID=A0A7S1YB25_9EUKA|mmetsp:Transcript_14951/g.46781  ORF Transcript_14951/g.46781 Transcript_14951/m.46781 type:complete len:342 (+) Transcript_14951:65-1090(+)